MNKLSNSKTLTFKIGGNLLKRIRKEAEREGFGEFELKFFVNQLILKALGIKK